MADLTNNPGLVFALSAGGVIVVLLLLFLIALMRALQKADATQAHQHALLTTGLPGNARVLQIRQTSSSSEGEALYLELWLEVVLARAPDAMGPSHGSSPPAFRVQLEVRVPSVAIPRVQPHTIIPVRCNPARFEDLVIDLPALGFG